MSEFNTVIMTRDEKGSPDGYTVVQYKKDCTYDLPGDLAAVFCNEMKCANPGKREQKSAEQEPEEVETPEAAAADLETPEKPKAAAKPKAAKTTPKK